MEISQFITPVAGVFGSIVQFIFYCALLAPVLFYFWFIKTYNIYCTVREAIGDKTFIEHRTRARIKNDRGVQSLVILKRINGRKIEMPTPDAGALNFNAKGKKCVTVCVIGKNSIYEKTSYNDIPKEFKKEFLATDAEIMYANQIKKANSREQLTVLKALNDHAGLIALTLIIVCGLAFADNIAAPLIKIQETQAKNEKLQQETTQALTNLYQTMIQNKQIIAPAGGAP